ncbi:MAG: tetratricopeptide repeat protein [Bacteroidota bacterium]
MNRNVSNIVKVQGQMIVWVRMTQKGIVIWLVILSCLQVEANDPSKEVIGQAISDTAYQLEQAGDLDQADLYYRKAIQYAQAQHLSALEGKNFRYLGLLFNIRGQYDSALVYYRAGMSLVQMGKDTAQQAKLHNDMGNLLNFLGDFQGAIEQYLEASERFESIDQDSINGILYANIGYSFFELGDFQKAEFYDRKALDIAQNFEMKSSIGVAFLNIGSVLAKLGEHDSAFAYYQQALSFAQLYDNQALEMRSIANLAGLEEAKKRYPEAVGLARRALSLASLPDQQIAMQALLGQFLTHTGDYAEARSHLNRSLQQARVRGLKEDEREALRHLAVLEEKLGRSEEANAFLTAFIALSDSLQSVAIHEQSQRLTVLYETERKEKENQLLKVENAEKVQALQVSQTISQRNLLLFLLAASLFLTTGILFLFYRNHATHKQQLAEQTAEMNQRKLEQVNQAHQLHLMKAMLEGQESERNRLAKDLHDGLGGLLSSAKLQFEHIQRSTPVLESHHDFDRATDLLQKAGSELRQIAHDLMPANLLKFGLLTALEDFVSEVNFSKQVSIDLQCYGLDRRLPEIYEISLYRIVQELVHNIMKHASASEAFIQLFQEDGTIHLTVEDNGIGIEAERWQHASGQGIRNIQSRIHYLDGEMDMRSRPGEGTSIMIHLILNKHDSITHRR